VVKIAQQGRWRLHEPSWVRGMLIELESIRHVEGGNARLRKAQRSEQVACALLDFYLVLCHALAVVHLRSTLHARTTCNEKCANVTSILGSGTQKTQARFTSRRRLASARFWALLCQSPSPSTVYTWCHGAVVGRTCWNDRPIDQRDPVFEARVIDDDAVRVREEHATMSGIPPGKSLFSPHAATPPSASSRFPSLETIVSSAVVNVSTSASTECKVSLIVGTMRPRGDFGPNGASLHTLQPGACFQWHWYPSPSRYLMAAGTG